jgi:hypothetical protein
MARSQITISKKRYDRSEIFDPLGNINNTDGLHAHIAYTSEKYQDWQNYPGIEFRIDKKRQFFTSAPFGVSCFYRLNKVIPVPISRFSGNT